MILIQLLGYFLLCNHLPLIQAGDAPKVAPFSFPPALKNGERGSVTCTIRSGDTPVEFLWKKDDQNIQGNDGIKIQSVLDSSILVISSVSSKSSGNYSCVVKNSVGSDQFTSILKVTAPPIWKVEPTDLHTQEGASEVIYCEASGVPQPDIKWIKGGEEQRGDVITIDPSSNLKVLPSGTLSFNKIESSMNGMYTCIADNNLGTVLSKSIFVSVRDPPILAQFSFPSALKEGERGSATCTIRSGDTPLEFTWLKDGQDVRDIEGVRIKSDLDSSFLIIPFVTSKSSGNYTCIVKNAFGSDRYTSTLAVSAPPVWKVEPMNLDIQEGGNAHISCEASGVPQPEIKWLQGEENGSTITEDSSSGIKTLPGGILSFTKVEASMQGSYTCIADNSFGKPISKTISLKVREIVFLLFVVWKTDANDAPDVASFSFPTGLKEGQRGSATCTIKSGERPFDFQWLKNGDEIVKSSNVKIQNVLDSSFLVIEAVSSESNGNYTCIVKNLYGSDRFTATLNVAAAPTWIKEPTDALVEEGDSISIDCSASGEPKPSVKWLKSEGNTLISNDISSAMSVSASGTLTVNKVEAVMQGSYTCTAENEIGKPISKSITILVRGKYKFCNCNIFME
ncbi:hypothetical protein JTE90_017445 [Oedothorax gibbosus]|uniref:Ig-like domain-containing protein n=1 Tax=Oedothorax gibbosus TaxID=931172 RepID=A0AAV6U2X4_9ARAC|nr:hypothetical protein JTE90_017445 [Oedothorax gibbosus]